MTTTDPTEAARRDLLPEVPRLVALEREAGRPVWTTDEMREAFRVEGFMAPFVVVVRKADGARGSLMFDGSPRLYFGWSPE